MEITNVRLYKVPPDPNKDGRVKAYASVTLDDCFSVRHIRLVQTEKGLLVSMPSRKLPDGSHKDVAHPINQEFRKKLETAILAEYHKADVPEAARA